jgi:hypothetical protein
MKLFNKKRAALWLAKKGFDVLSGNLSISNIAFDIVEKQLEDDSNVTEKALKKYQKSFEGEISKFLNHNGLRRSLLHLVHDTDTTTTKNILKKIVGVDKYNLYAVPLCLFAQDAQSSIHDFYSGSEGINQYYKDIFPDKSIDDSKKIMLCDSLSIIGGILTAAQLNPDFFKNLKFGLLKNKSVRTVLNWNNKHWLVYGINNDTQWGSRVPKGHCYIRYIEFSELNQLDQNTIESNVNNLEARITQRYYPNLINEICNSLNEESNLRTEYKEKLRIKL